MKFLIPVLFAAALSGWTLFLCAVYVAPPAHWWRMLYG